MLRTLNGARFPCHRFPKNLCQMKKAENSKKSTIFYLSLAFIAAYTSASLYFSANVIPVHYNLGMQPTEYGGKYNLLSLSVVNLLINTMLFIATRNPSKLNLGVSINDSNKTPIHNNAINILYSLIVIATLLFAAIALMGLHSA